MNEKAAKEVVSRNMEKLPEKEQVVLKKLYLENKTIYTTAKELKITRRTVRYRRDNAVRHLKTEILREIGNLGITLIMEGW